MSKRLNIMLPDATVSVLDRVTTRGTRSKFIARAVHHFVEYYGRATLRERLKAEAIENAERDLAIAAEWFPLEQEAQQILESSQAPKKTARARRR
jgi:metal-responsive CopG/Arc/MetJ family transcriptional regulator